MPGGYSNPAVSTHNLNPNPGYWTPNQMNNAQPMPMGRVIPSPGTSLYSNLNPAPWTQGQMDSAQPMPIGMSRVDYNRQQAMQNRNRNQKPLSGYDGLYSGEPIPFGEPLQQGIMAFRRGGRVY
jgi:hypothetical protein